MRHSQQRLVTKIGLVVTSAAIAMMVGACGSPSDDADTTSTQPTDGPSASASPTESAESSGEFRSASIPASSPQFDEAALPKKPADDAPFKQKIEYKLLSETAEFAQLVDPASKATCPAVDATKDSTIECTVVYKGLSVPWTVKITGGQYVASYRAEAPKKPISREYAENYLRFREKTEEVACDMPEAVLVTPGADTGITCKSRSDGEITEFDYTVSAYGTARFNQK